MSHDSIDIKDHWAQDSERVIVRVQRKTMCSIHWASTTEDKPCHSPISHGAVGHVIMAAINMEATVTTDEQRPTKVEWMWCGLALARVVQLTPSTPYFTDLQMLELCNSISPRTGAQDHNNPYAWKRVKHKHNSTTSSMKYSEDDIESILSVPDKTKKWLPE